MSYSVELLPAARRQLRKLPSKAQRQIRDLINTLADDPRMHGTKALKGDLKGFYRARSGNYRIIYTIKDELLLLLIVTIADRK